MHFYSSKRKHSRQDKVRASCKFDAPHNFLEMPLGSFRHLECGVNTLETLNRRYALALEPVVAHMKKSIKKSTGGNKHHGVRQIRDRGSSGGTPKSFDDLLKKTKMGKISKAVVHPSNHRLVKVPAKPLPGQPPSLWMAKKEAEVEELMLRGITQPMDLALVVKGVTVAKIAVLIDRIRARWTITGSAWDVKKARGEALMYNGMMKKSIWELTKSDKSTNDTKVASLGLLTRLFGVQLMLEGVTVDAIDELSKTADETGEVMQRIKRQKNLGGIAGKLLDIVLAMREQKAATGQPQNKKLPPVIEVNDDVVDDDSEDDDDSDD